MERYVYCLNAPQGFMLIPTNLAEVCEAQDTYGLNAPQGFMLIPTKLILDSRYSLNTLSLNAPQGFMLIPTGEDSEVNQRLELS